MLVSILFPVYNVAPYLREAIDSMLAQTFTDFELIILNDCSPDNSAEIIAEYNDPRIVVYNGTENVGLANILNVGIKLAKGKYIARMDSDDISLPNRLEIQVNHLENNPDIDLCSCGMELFGAKNEIWIREVDPEDIKITMLFYSPILHASSIWRREIFIKHNLFFVQSMVPAEDYDLWSRAIQNCKLTNIPDILYKYRMHVSQVTTQNERVMKKTCEVRTNFIKTALPSLTEYEISAFTKEHLSLKETKNILKTIITANKKDNFFNQERLEYRLKRYWQAQYFAAARTEFKLSYIKELRLKQIFKLLKESIII